MSTDFVRQIIQLKSSFRDQISKFYSLNDFAKFITVDNSLSAYDFPDIAVRLDFFSFCFIITCNSSYYRPKLF